MTIYQALVQGYARAIYIDGLRTFTSIIPAYVEPVKQYAAANYTPYQIDTALAKEYISQQDYADTLAYIPSAS
ncbi:hypothetical protein [Paenibacillus naphthalenovorans]|uniref:hypothetical protein n=1 Tax=Paenibacillus naphthalenovorans TaxID=162209 RepID=UPI00087FF7AF|nr:hypothetical protein [Paenibacillus naphthalenovorans]SDJ93057.1 hypothetical protein SAMN05421868_15911 [Paenibacillus naphthalenovorans]